MTTQQILISARDAVSFAAALTEEQKNLALSAMAQALRDNCGEIIAANGLDMLAAQDKISSVMLDRLRLDKQRIFAMAAGIDEVTALPDPVGEICDTVIRPSGIKIEKTRVPMGVIAVIYESRPNVTSDAAALILKSGNVAVLRTGKEAINSGLAIIKAMRSGLTATGLPENLINIIEDTSRDSANELMTARGLVDLLIPRGGAGLIRSCLANATVPCIETGTGMCHIYVDKSADFGKALNIIENAKASRPSVCNAAECVLVHRDIANEFLPLMKSRLADERIKNGLSPVTLRCCENSLKIIDGEKAEENDYRYEHLDYILTVKIVDNTAAAIRHISEYSTYHSDAIISEDKNEAALFTKLVDSAAVYVNASTRFTDGGEFGLGCEIGISTQKLHARGPMGLKELTTYKYIVRGDGQIR